jgi:hypothetical protein
VIAANRAIALIESVDPKSSNFCASPKIAALVANIIE